MNIKKLREKTGLSQKKFADKYYLNVRTLQNWEQGNRVPPDYVPRLIERIIQLEENQTPKP